MNRDPLDILTQYWGYDSFREPQEAIIGHILKGKDTLALLPTGGGKSICFQVPGLSQEGLTIVISPLIALMKDQVSRLNQMGIAATFINSSMSGREIAQKLDQVQEGTYKFLYLAPERITSSDFIARLPTMPVTLLAVDEAHCISQWGYDFRPAYLQIHKIREVCSGIPIIALTASATPQVEQDICEKLELRTPKKFRKSFRRENLRYFVLKEENVAHKILEIINRVQGSGIVYARTRKRTESVAAMLRERGISAGFYHGGMTYSQRSEVQQKWIDNELRVMVATNAFGMGIDKGDVRFVLHYNLPADLESYYQEAGRGGRDGQTALAIAFDNPIDLAELTKWSQEKYPPWKQIQSHYGALCTHFKIQEDSGPSAELEVDLQVLAKALDTRPFALLRSLQILTQEGILQYQSEADDFGYIQVRATPDTVMQYKAQHPQSARFIDFLLRTLGGHVFTQEVRFLPRTWARKLNYEEAELTHMLHRLSQHYLIHYTPPSGIPTIKFLGNKRKLRKSELQWEKYEFLKTQQQVRLQEMLAYVSHREVCRSLRIQQYFGEKDHQPCGKCDVCIGRNKTRVSDRAFKQIQRSLIAYLHTHSPSPYPRVLQEVKEGSPAQREKVLRYLLDKGVIQVLDDGALHLPK